MFYMSDFEDNLAANAVTGNVLSGRAHEFLKEDSQVIIGVVAEKSLVFCTVIVGDEVLMDDQEISAQNRMPVAPDDFILRTVGLAGSQITIRFRNGNGATTADCFTAVIVDPI